ncbi:MAG: zinc ribbon domain-containing protein [Microbacteriaceae bacterium]|nr:zinc ribbon domain-containing protein [Microbacteriaceae bacterium]
MGKCTNCGAALDPGWKFCIACGASVTAPNETRSNGTEADETTARESDTPSTPTRESIPSAPTRESIPSAIRSDEPDDEPLPRKRMDAAIIFGIAMAVGGGVLIILVAMALFSPRG